MGCGPERTTIKKLTDYLDTISGNEAASEQLTRAYTEGTAKAYLAGQGVELTEEELQGVAAGATSFREYTSVVRDGTNVTANYVDYEWRDTDENQKYLCPNCRVRSILVRHGGTTATPAMKAGSLRAF